MIEGTVHAFVNFALYSRSGSPGIRLLGVWWGPRAELRRWQRKWISVSTGNNTPVVW